MAQNLAIKKVTSGYLLFLKNLLHNIDQVSWAVFSLKGKLTEFAVLHRNYFFENVL